MHPPIENHSSGRPVSLIYTSIQVSISLIASQSSHTGTPQFTRDENIQEASKIKDISNNCPRIRHNPFV